jgi:hypothetical protein
VARPPSESQSWDVPLLGRIFTSPALLASDQANEARLSNWLGELIRSGIKRGELREDTDMDSFRYLIIANMSSSFRDIMLFGGNEPVKQLTLRTLDRLVYTASGVVLDQLGTGAAGARIMFSQRTVMADEDGHFEMDVSYLVPGSVLFATLPGCHPARVEGLPERLKRDVHGAQGMLLRLGEPTGSIHGRVVDEAGNPQTDAIVFLVDGTPYGGQTTRLEDVLDGRQKLGLAVDGAGRFVYGGLLQSEYTLQAYLPDSFLSAQVTVRTGDEAETQIVLSRQKVLQRLAGRVVDSRGEPVPNAVLGLTMILGSTASGGKMSRGVELGSTGADGNFEFKDVAYEGLRLYAKVSEGEPRRRL